MQLTLGAEAARADSPALPLKLDWSAPPECPTAAQVLEELGRIARVGSGDQSLLEARAQIRREGNEYVLLLSTVREGDTRDKQVRAPQCATLQHMATLILGLALGDSVELIIDDSKPQRETEPSRGGKPNRSAEPNRSTEASPQAGTPPGGASTSAPAKDGDVVESESDAALDATSDMTPHAARKKARPRLVVFGALASNVGLLPEASLGPALGAGFVPRPRVAPELGLSLAALWPVAKSSVEPGVSASFRAIAARADACWASEVWKPELAACPLALSAGALFAESEGALRDDGVVAPWYAWTPSVRISLDLSRSTRIRLEPMAVFSPFHTQFGVAPAGEVHTVPFWSAAVELGIELDVVKAED